MKLIAKIIALMLTMGSFNVFSMDPSMQKLADTLTRLSTNINAPINDQGDTALHIAFEMIETAIAQGNIDKLPGYVKAFIETVKSGGSIHAINAKGQKPYDKFLLFNQIIDADTGTLLHALLIELQKQQLVPVKQNLITAIIELLAIGADLTIAGRGNQTALEMISRLPVQTQKMIINQLEQAMGQQTDAERKSTLEMVLSVIQAEQSQAPQASAPPDESRSKIDALIASMLGHPEETTAAASSAHMPQLTALTASDIDAYSNQRQQLEYKLRTQAPTDATRKQVSDLLERLEGQYQLLLPTITQRRIPLAQTLPELEQLHSRMGRTVQPIIWEAQEQIIRLNMLLDHINKLMSAQQQQGSSIVQPQPLSLQERLNQAMAARERRGAGRVAVAGRGRAHRRPTPTPVEAEPQVPDQVIDELYDQSTHPRLSQAQIAHIFGITPEEEQERRRSGFEHMARHGAWSSEVESSRSRSQQERGLRSQQASDVLRNIFSSSSK